ncbi:Protein InaA [Pseudomonas sp. 8Z]|uniref:lipopolysaccharide kinase InaA family protein n=1 Tax=Pseudomonas sp. 8Z TaxID=2653166 RepID=UPI0012EF28B6|nr:lipopolysaccharide kinase InaA family protein [Pseudomonas sp. 8Z]VXD01738.1 Protein InaA [Pseudomonas sp. 8Z]
MGILSEKALAALPSTEFERWWHSPGEWVEEANQRRGGESGVRLLQSWDDKRPPLYCKRQSGHTHRSWRHPLGRPTILRELEAYRGLARLGIRTPNIVYCAARREAGQWQALLVTEALQGFISLEQWYAQTMPQAHTQAMLNHLAITLARMHLGGWQHGCCYAKHIFVRAQSAGDIEIALLDLEKSRRRWRTQQASQHDLSQLQRHRGNMPESDMHHLLQAYQHALHNPWGVLQP